ncbi:hypothetical protein, partial [Janthinobacterium sp. CAN_S1]|uniref:hypothetical protein n=1 Tax=Janthinobacterium sp. CAN_S1 TaxID=2787725 RepID=UPI002FF37407
TRVLSTIFSGSPQLMWSFLTTPISTKQSEYPNYGAVWLPRAFKGGFNTKNTVFHVKCLFCI